MPNRLARCSILSFFLTALLLAACPDPDVQAESPDRAESALEMRLSDPPRVEMLPDATVEAALQAWLTAQNEGDYEAYSAAYADRFFGIKRSGPRTYRFERKGWLADRKRMFRKSFEVKADKVEIATARTTATVTFAQTWSSGTYQDVGPKQLVFVTAPDGSLRIAREEMLRSKLLHEVTTTSNTGAARFAFVEKVDGDPWVLLDLEAGDQDWGIGEPRLVSAEPSIAKRRVDTSKLPSELAGTVGKKLRLFSEVGPVCTATVTDLAVVARFWPHFGQSGMWRESDGPSDPEIAQEIWSMGPEALVGRLKPSPGEDCEGARGLGTPTCILRWSSRWMPASRPR